MGWTMTRLSTELRSNRRFRRRGCRSCRHPRPAQRPPRNPPSTRDGLQHAQVPRLRPHRRSPNKSGGGDKGTPREYDPPAAAASQPQPRLHINLVHTSPPRRVPGEGAGRVDVCPCLADSAKGGVWEAATQAYQLPRMERCIRPHRHGCPRARLSLRRARVSTCPCPRPPSSRDAALRSIPAEDHARESESYWQETQMKQQHSPLTTPVRHPCTSVPTRILSASRTWTMLISSRRTIDSPRSCQVSPLTHILSSPSSSASSIEIPSRPPVPQISHPIAVLQDRRPVSIASTEFDLLLPHHIL
jgi:hypothetical protein